MLQKIKTFLSTYLILLLLPGFLAFAPVEIQAAPEPSGVSVIKKAKKKKSSRRRSSRRKYYPERTKQQAKDIIRRNSPYLSMLAGLDPMSPDEGLNPEEQEMLNLMINGNEEDEEEGDLDDEEMTDEEIETEIAELELQDDIPVDIETFRLLWMSYIADDSLNYEITECGIRKQDIMDFIMDWLGTPYKFGGASRKGIDCSAFTRQAFKYTSDIWLPRTARTQIKVGKKIDKEELQFGDMVFFYTYSRKFASHVGIYLGDDLFAHASSRYGVTVSSIKGAYYQKRFIHGVRLTVSDLLRYSTKSYDEDKDFTKNDND